MLDSGVARRFRNGDPEAVRAVYRAYGGLVFTVAHNVLEDRGLAEQATQQAFAQAWRTAGDYDLTGELGPWLAVIARRAASDVLRHDVIRLAHMGVRRAAVAPSGKRLSGDQR